MQKKGALQSFRPTLDPLAKSCDSNIFKPKMLGSSQFQGKTGLSMHSCAFYGIYGISSPLTSTEVGTAPLVKASNCSSLSCSLE